MRISDFFLVLPTIVLAIILAPVILDVVGADAELFGIRATMIVIVVVIGLTSWAMTARVVRSQVLSIKSGCSSIGRGWWGRGRAGSCAATSCPT